MQYVMCLFLGLDAFFSALASDYRHPMIKGFIQSPSKNFKLFHPLK